MNTVPFEECTFFKVVAPAGIERIGIGFYPHMPPDNGINWVNQSNHFRFSVRLLPAGVGGEHAATVWRPVERDGVTKEMGSYLNTTH